MYVKATTLADFGIVHSSMNEYQKALEFFNQALPIRRSINDRRGEGNALLAAVRKGDGRAIFGKPFGDGSSDSREPPVTNATLPSSCFKVVVKLLPPSDSFAILNSSIA